MWFEGNHEPNSLIIETAIDPFNMSNNLPAQTENTGPKNPSWIV